MKHPKAVLTVVGPNIRGTVAFYTYTTYLQKVHGKHSRPSERSCKLD